MYLGLSAFSLSFKSIIWSFVGSVLVATVVARVVSVFVPIICIWVVNGGEIPLQWSQVFLIAIGGVIRGAIAFGLSLQIDTPNKEVLKTTTQLIVLGSTVVLGCLMGGITRFLNIKTDQEIRVQKHLRAQANV